MAVNFVNDLTAEVTVKIQYDVNGNVWRSSLGEDKGAYKTQSFTVAGASNYGDLFDDSDTSAKPLSNLLNDVFEFDYSSEEGTIKKSVVAFNRDVVG